jgi:hypothetical protein
MFERFRRKNSSPAQPARPAASGHDDYDRTTRGGVATAPREERAVGEPRFRREDVREVRARQREEYGGVNWGSAFFGWLVAVGMAAILLGLLSAAGAAFGLSDVSDTDAEQNAETIGIIGGILLIGVLAVAYYCGGYVSGRMSRFDGARQGFAVWALGLAVTIVLAVAGALFGAEYNVLERLNLPRIPIDEGSLTLGAAVALAAVVLATLFAATVGGKAGERFHRKVDRLAYRD